VQGWNGTSWVTLGTVTGNSLVMRTVSSFTAFKSDRIRLVNVNQGALRVVELRIVELEAKWGGN
jgi:hypothetical protein